MQEDVDELNSQLSAGLEGKDRIDVLNQLAWRIRTFDVKRANQYMEEARHLAEKINYARGIAWNNIPLAFQWAVYEGRTLESIEHLKTSLSIFEEEKDLGGQSMAHGVLALIHWNSGRRELAFDHVLRGRELNQTNENPEATAWATYILGTFYMEMGDYDRALPLIEEAEEHFVAIRDYVGLSACLNNRGNILRVQKKYDEAISYHEQSMAIAQELKQPVTIARAFRDLGRVYEELDRLEAALEHYQESLRLRKEAHNLAGIITTETDMGRLMSKLGRFEESANYLREAERNATQAQAHPKLVNIREAWVDHYRAKKEPWQALEAYEAFVKTKQEVEGEQNMLQLRNLNSQHQAEQARKEAEIERLRNVELNEAYARIERQQEDILASIRYARRIQEAILEPVEVVESQLPQGMVFYRPRDIVSGDFYWYSRLGSKQIIAAVDCTGHGVPGAFMVVLSNGLLNDIVNTEGITDPGQILMELDRRLTATLQREGHRQTQDGLDIALAVIDRPERKLYFAGAKNSLLYVRQGKRHRIPASRHSIGGRRPSTQKDFSTQELPLQSGDVFYLYSDGYQDQFGGPQGRKYMSKRFRNLLFDLHPMHAVEKKSHLALELTRWQAGEKQTDDVLIISWQEP